MASVFGNSAGVFVFWPGLARIETPLASPASASAWALTGRLAEVGRPAGRAGRRDRRHEDGARGHHHEEREGQGETAFIAKQLHQFS